MGSRKIVSCLVLALAIVYIAGQSTAAPVPFPAAPLVRDEWDGGILGPGQGCSTVYATDGQQILGGNNEDSAEPLTRVWLVPAGEGTYGLVHFGYGNCRAQGGMSD